VKKDPKPITALGDGVEKIARKTGLKKATEIFSELTGLDCGCDERKVKLNLLFHRQGYATKCLTKDEYTRLGQVLAEVERNKNAITKRLQREIATIYSQAFQTRFEIWCNNCPSIWKARIGELAKLYQFYMQEQNAAG
jgi:hypothetical protein